MKSTELKTVILGEHAKVISGFAIKSGDFQEEGIPVIKIGNIKIGSVSFSDSNTQYVQNYFKSKLDRKFHVNFGDILISLTGSHMTQPNSVVGRVAQYSHHFLSFLNQRAGKIININDKVFDEIFLYFLLSTKEIRTEIALMAHGAASQANVSPKDVEKLRLNIPDIDIQKKIAAILSTYDDLIENNKRRIALLENMAEEIYREWFVRFRFPGYQNAEFEKGIPKGWETGEAYLFFDHVKGKSYKSEEISEVDENSIPFITLKSFNRGGGYRSNGLKSYLGKFSKNQVVREGDVVMAVTDMTQNREVVGRVARVPDMGEKGAVISLDVIKLVPKTISATYLYSYMKYSGFGHFIKSFANGTNVLHLKPDLVTQQVIVLPTQVLREKFKAFADPIHEQIGLLGKEIDNLEQTKNSLLPRLVSGKLSVEALNIQFPPSM